MLYNKNQTERSSLVGPRMRKTFLCYIYPKICRVIILYECVQSNNKHTQLQVLAKILN